MHIEAGGHQSGQGQSQGDGHPQAELHCSDYAPALSVYTEDVRYTSGSTGPPKAWDESIRCDHDAMIFFPIFACAESRMSRQGVMLQHQQLVAMVSSCVEHSVLEGNALDHNLKLRCFFRALLSSSVFIRRSRFSAGAHPSSHQGVIQFGELMSQSRKPRRCWTSLGRGCVE